MTHRGTADDASRGGGSRIRVLHVLDDLETGGAEWQVTACILRSDASRFSHEVCVLSGSGRFAAELQEAGIPVHSLSVRPGKDFVRAVGRLRRLVRTIDPDLLHATLYRPGIVSRLVGHLCGKPVLTTLVSTTYEPEWRLDNPRLTPAKVWMAQTLDRLTTRWAGAHFVAISESVKASAIRHLGLVAEQIQVIPRGVVFDGGPRPRSDEVVAARQKLGWEGAYPVILNVGRLVPPKGQRYAIRAMRHVVRQYPAARLAIAGDGWLHAELAHLIRSLGLEGHVILLGEREDIDVLLHAADIFVFPSLFEGLGNALLEAMAAGKPCVVSRIPTFREVTGDGAVALLAAARAPEDLAAKLVQLAEDRVLAQQLGHAAQAWVRSRYDIRTSVTALEGLYQHLAAPEQIRRTRRVSTGTIAAAHSPAVTSPVDPPVNGRARFALEQTADALLRRSGVLALLREIDSRESAVVRILLYHRVSPVTFDPTGGDPDVMSATPEAFAAHIDLLVQHYVPIGMPQLEDSLRGISALPRRALLVTFDDGYRDFLTYAWPVLKARGVPVLLFVPTTYPDRERCYWWDELWQMLGRAAGPTLAVPALGQFDLRTVRGRWSALRQIRRLLRPLHPDVIKARMAELREMLGTPPAAPSMLMGWEELRRLAREGGVVASHGQRHASLPALTDPEVGQEIEGAQRDLERELGSAQRIFAYPFGHYDRRAAAALERHGFVAAFGQTPGRNIIPGVDRFGMFRQSVNTAHSFSRVQLGLSGFYPQTLVRIREVVRPHAG